VKFTYKADIMGETKKKLRFMGQNGKKAVMEIYNWGVEEKMRLRFMGS